MSDEHLHDWRPDYYDRITECTMYVCRICGQHGYQTHTGGPIIEGEPEP